MKKEIIIIGMAVLLICVGLSGCFDTTDDESKSSKLGEVLEYNMEEVTDSTDTFMSVNGTVKNIAGKLIEVLFINVHFYDSDNNELGIETDLVVNLPNSYTDSFSVQYYNYESYYEEVNHVGFSFEEGNLP